MESAAAKQFLIEKVTAEAEMEQVSLSDIERKILQFSEVHPSLPNLYQVNEEFERSYDSAEYEAKVAHLLRNARDRDRKNSASNEQQWEDALDALRDEDHYILVMVSQAFGSSSTSPVASRFRDFLIYIAVAVCVVLFLVWKASR